MSSKSITIKPESQGQRLDKFLAEKLSDKSRSQIKKMILDGAILVNGAKTAVHKFLKQGDIIKIKPFPLLSSPRRRGSRPTESGSRPAVREQRDGKTVKNNPDKKLFPKIKILTDEPDFLIINKPSGLLVHPTDKNETDTLVDWLLAKYPRLKQIGEDPSRPAIVHRLDKEVSGLMLIPKNQPAFDYFKKLFATRQLTKKYTALVHGAIAKDEAKIDFPITRSKTKPGLFAALPNSHDLDEAKRAITNFYVKKRFRNYTLLEVEILTGRTHQIRVHLLAYGHPVVGDKLYGKKTATTDRIFLHAAELAFVDPQGQKRKYTSPLPRSLQNFLKNLA